MGPTAKLALLDLRALHDQQLESVQELRGQIKDLEHQLDWYTEAFSELVTQVTDEFGAVPGPKFGAVPGPKFDAVPGPKEEDPETVAAIHASLEEDEAAWAECGMKSWQAACAGVGAGVHAGASAGASAKAAPVSRLLDEVEERQRAARLRQQKSDTQASMLNGRFGSR